MPRDFPGSDWKIFRQLRETALERFCARVLEEARRIMDDQGRSHHDRYCAVFKLLDRRDRDLVQAFNGARRSTAFLQLTYIRSLKLVTDAEMSRFSEETRRGVEGIVSIGNDR